MGELAEPWNGAAERAGIRQTYRGIADAAGISHVTVRRLIAEGRTSAATIRKVAGALRVETKDVAKWAGMPVSEWGPWDPPIQAHRLNPRARAALEELILAITEGGQQDDRQSEAQKSHDVTPGLDATPAQGDVTLAAWDGEPTPGMLGAQQSRTLGEESQDSDDDHIA